jgi:hypothetical protein
MWQEAGMAKRFGLAMALTMLVSPGFAQSVPPPVPEVAAPVAAEWQGVIHSQAQAFREYDAAGALSYAVESFKKIYPNPEAFFVAIIGAGYAPIMNSRSESFGDYQVVSPEIVFQDVKFVGKDQGLYDAVYQLHKEAEGWRVQAVQLSKLPDVGA